MPASSSCHMHIHCQHFCRNEVLHCVFILHIIRCFTMWLFFFPSSHLVFFPLLEYSTATARSSFYTLPPDHIIIDLHVCIYLCDSLTQLCHLILTILLTNSAHFRVEETVETNSFQASTYWVLATYQLLC